jgi:DNA-binding protein YbaB
VTAAKDLMTAQRERSRAQVARYHQIRAALEKLRVRAGSTDRSVTVEMAAGGAIVDLRITERAMDKSPDALAATIMDAIRRGLAKVAERTAAEVEPLTGHRLDVTSVASGRLPSLSVAANPNATDDPDAARFLPEDD